MTYRKISKGKKCPSCRKELAVELDEELDRINERELEADREAASEELELLQ